MDAANDLPTTLDTAISLRHREVELMAFTFWRQRGSPIGTPEIDWLRAEAEINIENGDVDPALSLVAKAIGSALGTVAALVTAEP